MHTFNIILGESALNWLADITDIYKSNVIQRLFEQHKLVVSDYSLKFYFDDNIGNDMQLQPVFCMISDKWDNLINLEQKTEATNYKEAVTKLIKEYNINNCIIVASKTDFEDSNLDNVEIYDFEKLIADNCEIKKYTRPYISSYRVGDDGDVFRNWFKNICANEKIIRIQDPYIFRCNGKRHRDYYTGDIKPNIFLHLDIFLKYYLPLIPEDAELELYYSEDSDTKFDNNLSEKEIKERLCKYVSGTRRITIFRKEGIHDRFIWGDKWTIFIGFGLDIFDKYGVINRNTGVVFCNSKSFPHPDKPSDFGEDGKSNIMIISE